MRGISGPRTIGIQSAGVRGRLTPISYLLDDTPPATLIKPPHRRNTMTRIRLHLLIALLLVAAACVNAPQETPAAGKAGDTPGSGAVRIGFSMDTLKEERWQRDKALVEQRAKEV